MPQLPIALTWTGVPPDPLAHPELYDGLLWRRSFAYLFDVIIIGLLLLAGWSSLILLGVLSFGLLLPLVPLLVALIPVAYHALQVGGRHHATLGMRLFDLEVKTWSGGQPDVWQGFLMAALFYARWPSPAPSSCWSLSSTTAGELSMITWPASSWFVAPKAPG